MNKFRFLKDYLLSESGEVGVEAAESSESSEQNESSGVEKYMDDSNLPGESGNVENESEETSSEDSPSDLDSLLEGVDTGENPDLIQNLNDLGVIRAGMPVEFKDLDEVKELLSKGYDYTQKTQELSDSRKQAETELATERESFEKERADFNEQTGDYSEVTQQNDIMGEVLNDLQTNDPALFEEIALAYRNKQNSFNQQLNNPAFDKISKELAELKGSLTSQKETEVEKQHESIRESWNNELKEAQTAYAPKLRKLGIKADWDKVKEKWSSDATGNTNVKQALQALYGEEIQKAMANESKLAATKNKSSLRRGPEHVEQEISGNKGQHGSDSHMNYLEELLKKHG